jgi:hypothetical protein
MELEAQLGLREGTVIALNEDEAKLLESVTP